MALRIAQNTRSPSLTDTLTVDGVAFDLTGSTVKFQMRAVGTTGATLKVDTAATVVTPAAGTVRYDWGASDLDTAGDFVGWWLVTLPSAKTQKHPDFVIDVQPASQPAVHLCEVQEVRDQLQKPDSDRAQDTAIERLIAAASTLIMRETEREFAPAGTAGVSRDFRAETANLVNFAPYDLQTATAVILDPESGSPTTLDAADYRLVPVEQFDGVYTHMFIGVRAPLGVTTTQQDYGWRQIRVTGTWGFPSVPASIRHACVVTVALWMRREIQTFTQTFNITEDRLEVPEALPAMVRAGLNRWRRMGSVV